MRKVVELELYSGETVLVSPLSFILLRRLQEAAAAKHPEIDKAAYEAPLPGSVFEGEKYMPPEQEAAYEAAVAARNHAYNRELSELWAAVATDHQRGRDRVIADYAPTISQARAMGLIAADVDDWRATLVYAVCKGDADLNRILNTASSELPLSEAEISDAVATFRRPLPRLARAIWDTVNTAAGTPEDEATPAATEAG